MKETAKETGKATQKLYVCPECGEPLTDVTATETHHGDVYEVRLRGRH